MNSGEMLLALVALFVILKLITNIAEKKIKHWKGTYLQEQLDVVKLMTGWGIILAFVAWFTS